MLEKVQWCPREINERLMRLVADNLGIDTATMDEMYGEDSTLFQMYLRRDIGFTDVDIIQLGHDISNEFKIEHEILSKSWRRYQFGWEHPTLQLGQGICSGMTDVKTLNLNELETLRYKSLISENNPSKSTSFMQRDFCIGQESSRSYREKYHEPTHVPDFTLGTVRNYITYLSDKTATV